MITAYVSRSGTLAALHVAAGEPLPDDAVWIDLFSPSKDEEAGIEAALNIDVPSREEMQEIEVSSRLYQENNALYMTATLLIRADTETPQNEPMTFMLAGNRLVTLRYADSLPFQLFAAQAQRQPDMCASGDAMLAGLLDAVVDRIADILERVQNDMSALSRDIFSQGRTDFEAVLRQVGLAESLTSRARESLVSIGRMVLFLGRPGEARPGKIPARAFKTLSRDVASLSDHASFLGQNIDFLLNATLGMINIEQTGIIKIFSVAAVVFLPPTLIASIYGMNFRLMPELALPFGYPLSLLLMVISAVLPYLYFKRKGWL